MHFSPGIELKRDHLYYNAIHKIFGVPLANTAPHILDITSLDQFLANASQPRFRRSQVLQWLFEKDIYEIEGMTNLSKDFRHLLKENFVTGTADVMERIDSQDGASKLLLKSHRGLLMESVIIRYENRVSLCVSSQVGCRLACTFCQTGKLGFMRNLKSSEILQQAATARQILKKEGRRLSHIVFMGMGEPLDNYNEVVTACKWLTAADGYGLSWRHVTVSTSGMAKRIYDLAKDVRVALAISLHAANDQLRTELMPINRRYNLNSLKDALKFYQRETKQKLTIEYILIKDTNCAIKHAKELVKYLHGLRAKVNLIPFNEHPGITFDRPEESDILAFQSYLSKRSLPAPVRYSKGLDVSAACGQLAAKNSQNLMNLPKRENLIRSHA